MRRNRKVLLASLVLGTLVTLLAARTQAQCGCLAPLLGYLMSGQVTFSFDSSFPSNLQFEFTESAGQWNNAAGGSNSPAMFAGPVTPGTGNLVISVGTIPENPTAWAKTNSDGTGGTITFNQNSFGGWNQNFRDSNFAHELGHVEGYGDVTTGGCSWQDTVMFGTVPYNSTDAAPMPTCSDSATVQNTWGAPGGCNPTDCSPLLINLGHGQPALTGAEVWFDMAGAGIKQLIGWTDPSAPDAFLVLDKNGNGMIDSGRELFGTFTRLSWNDAGPRAQNGFQALAWFDRPENGGNGDGSIDRNDLVFDRLLLWTDANHDGVSQPEELTPVSQAGITKIRLDANYVGLRDRFGNRMKFMSIVETMTSTGTVVERHIYDVFFVVDGQ